MRGRAPILLLALVGSLSLVGCSDQCFEGAPVLDAWFLPSSADSDNDRSSVFLWTRLDTDKRSYTLATLDDVGAMTTAALPVESLPTVVVHGTTKHLIISGATNSSPANAWFVASDGTILGGPFVLPAGGTRAVAVADGFVIATMSSDYVITITHLTADGSIEARGALPAGGPGRGPTSMELVRIGSALFIAYNRSGVELVMLDESGTHFGNVQVAVESDLLAFASTVDRGLIIAQRRVDGMPISTLVGSDGFISTEERPDLAGLERYDDAVLVPFPGRGYLLKDQLWLDLDAQIVGSAVRTFVSRVRAADRNGVNTIYASSPATPSEGSEATLQTQTLYFNSTPSEPVVRATVRGNWNPTYGCWAGS